jgi:4-amino-4-deoxy-L-arabinose transferase-like glycosyltransferase
VPRSSVTTPAAPERPPLTSESRQSAWRRAMTAAAPPRPLGALLLLTLLLGVTWSLVTPAFQAPDEDSHFGYTQGLAESFRLPGIKDRPKYSTEQALGGSLSNSDQTAAQLFVRMEWSRDAYDRWRARDTAFGHRQKTDGGGENPASPNPPLYYLFEAGAYRIGESGDLFTRLQMARLASVLWIALTVVGVWLLAGELFRRDRLLQLVAAGTAGLLPMVQFVSSAVNPDALLYALWSLALWAGVRLIRRGLTARGAAALFGFVGLACVVKATSLALLPGACFALIVALRRAPGSRAAKLRTVGAAVGGLAATLGVWLVVAALVHRPAAAQVAQVTTGHSSVNLREFASYLWQFYLPRLPFMTPFTTGAPHLAVYDAWLKTGWAGFGWLEVRFPEPVYVALALITLAIAIVALVVLVRERRRVDVGSLIFLAVVALSLLLGLHWTEYRLIDSGAGPFNVGRYLLPLVGIAGLAVALVVRALRPVHRVTGAALALSGLFALNLFSLALMLERFYV